MGTAHSQHSASVRVSPVCGYPKHSSNIGIKPISIHSEGPSTECARVTTGSEPHLASSSVRSIYKQAGGNLNTRWNSKRKDYAPRNETGRLSANGIVYDCAPLDSSGWARSSSRKKVRPRAMKQVSHNSTNSSYIADCSPDRSAAAQSELHISGRESFVAVNEHQLRLGLNRLSSIDGTYSTNGHFNSFNSPSRCDLASSGYTDKRSNLSEVDHLSSRLAQRRHLSELCLHLDGLNNNHNHRIPSALRSPRKSQPPMAPCFIQTYDFGTQTGDIGPFVRMTTTSASMCAPKSQMKSPSCQVTPAKSNHSRSNYLAAPHSSRSPLSSEAELLTPENDVSEDALDNYHDYANLPHSRSRSVKIPKRPQVPKHQAPQSVGVKVHSEESYEDTGRIPLPSRRLSKSRWRFMSRGKNLTKSISCYALKFFGQQNRSYESSDQLLAGTSQCGPHSSRSQQSQTSSSRPLTLAMLKRGATTGENPNPTPDDLGNNFKRVLRLGQSEDAEKSFHTVSVPNKMNRSLSAFGNQDSIAQRRHAMQRPNFQHSNKESQRRDKYSLLQTTSTKELLHCLSIFILQNCDNLCESHNTSSLLYPEEIIAWIRDIDRALIQQGWTDIPFLSPANVVFLFIMLKDFVDSTITCSRELHSLVMVCLYLSYGYMGNEISYPLKPFLNAEILYSMLHENDPQRFRNINTNDPMSSRNPKVVNRFRDAFWDTCIRVLKCKSKDMLRLNADSGFFNQSIAELRSYSNSPESKPNSSA